MCQTIYHHILIFIMCILQNRQSLIEFWSILYKNLKYSLILPALSASFPTQLDRQQTIVSNDYDRGILQTEYQVSTLSSSR